jgi:hypothetical protein
MVQKPSPRGSGRASRVPHRMRPENDDATKTAHGAPQRLRALLVGLLVAVPGYAAGVLLGIGLVQAFSDNGHDRAVEGAMTGAFVIGPIVALACFVGGALAYARRARRGAPDRRSGAPRVA